MTIASEDSTSLVLDLAIERSIDLSALRGQITTTLSDVDEDDRYDVLLVVSELVSNVLDHTQGPGRLRLLRTRARHEVVIEIDDSSPLEPVRGQSRLSDVRGRGIVMVDEVAKEWGTRALPGGGKTVYAKLRCAGAGPLP